MDVVAGSKAELNLVRSLRDRLSDLGFDVRLHPVEVVSWEDVNCLINGSIKCTSQPPQRSQYVSGVLGRDVLLTPTTEDPDNMWVIHGRAVKEGYEAVIFFDSYPEVRKRRIVLTGELSYSTTSKVRDDVLSVHIPLDVGLKLKELYGRRVDVEVKVRKVLSTGYNLEATYGEEPKMVVAAHHDRWLSGFRDDVNGLLILMKLAEEVSKKGGQPVRLVSFTAEEYGDPEEPLLYWAYGSRAYVSRYGEALENTLLFVVVDTAFTEPLEVSFVGLDEGLWRYVSNVEVVESNAGIAYTDALSALNLAIPTLVFHNIHKIKPVYHSDRDVYDLSVKYFNERVVNSLMGLAELANLRTSELINMVGRYLTSKVKYVGVDNPLKAFKCFVKHMLLLVNKGSYDKLDSELAVMSYEDLRSYGNQKFTLLTNDVELTPNSTTFEELYRKALNEFLECVSQGE
ncbi:MAG: hypothetical protein B7O98_08190 [Zestosphaera tikiterensis]|uniref:Peptidase M28 domain-containing protein n=1 Tax=Zestosphaera tikiterensis TaxID=1973259 RepID=A0A2R7Y330_9CREN|nr:MAG: hypothetical protein B7O98_08190 [Zestosphaera tikiterensis]